MEEFSEVLLDVQKEYKRSNKLKDIIIMQFTTKAVRIKHGKITYTRNKNKNN